MKVQEKPMGVKTTVVQAVTGIYSPTEREDEEDSAEDSSPRGGAGL